MTLVDRSSDLLNGNRNSFGLDFPNNIVSLGTKADVETFFLLLNDLILEGDLENCYSTVSHDLYRTLINRDNLERFTEESGNLKDAFAQIRSNQVAWEQYPFNRECGQFDYQQRRIDPAKPTLLDVFDRFFAAFERVPFWIEVAISENYPNARLIVASTEIRTGLKFQTFKDSDFINSSDDPLWLREPA